MKVLRHILLLPLLVTVTLIFSQSVSVNTLVKPPYSPYLSEYIQLSNKVVITLTNNQNSDKAVYLKARFFNNEGFEANTIDDYLPDAPIIVGSNSVYQLPANYELYSFFNEQNVEVNNGDVNISELLQDGVLPEGMYSLCIDVFDFNTHEQLNVPGAGCGMFNIQYLNAPFLLNPSCDNGDEQFKQPQSYNFNWMPVSGAGGQPIVYDLYIVPIGENDVPQDMIDAAIEGVAVNSILVSNINTNVLNYNMQHPINLSMGNYAWAVKARVQNGNYPIANNGLSQVCTFSLTNLNQQNQQNQQNLAVNENVDCSCKLPVPGGLSNANDLSIGAIVKTSHFEMEIQSFQKNGNLYSGTGYIALPIINSKLIKAKVNFTDIEIKKSGNDFFHTGGIIKANVHQDATPFLPKPDINDPGSISIGQNEMSNLSDFVKNNVEQKISWIKNAANSFAFSVPIGFDEKAISVIITDITFDPEQGYFQAASVIDMLDANSKFALLGKGICIDKNDFCGDVKLMLAKDFEVPVIGFTILGGINDSKATSLTFDKDGFKNLHIGAKYTFPSGSLVDKNTNTPASVILQSDTEKGWNDWVAEVEFSTFYISGFDEFSFGPDKNGTKMYYDHSDTRNPENIPNPYFSSDSNESPIATDLLTWRGFYIPAIQVNLPGCFINATTNTPITALAEKLIFDGGLSGNISVNNILAIGDGSLDSWYFSIEQFKIDLWKNSFKSSRLSGKVVLPLSKDFANTSNQLEYACTLSKPSNQGLGFSFEIVPKSDMYFDIFWAQTRLIHGTSISLEKKDGQSFFAKAALFGSMNIATKIKGIPDIKLAEIHFKNIRVQSKADFFAYDDIQFSLASPQHSIAGFTIDLDPAQGKGVSLYIDENDRFKVGLKFKALLKLVADADFVPRADVEFNVFGKIAFENNRPKWEGLDASLNNISFGAEAKIGPIGVIGSIAYFNDDKGSYGFMGGLDMNIAEMFSLGAKAQFGYQAQGYNYFFIDGMVDFGKAGIPLGGGLALYGFGGGVYYNMEQAQTQYSGDKISGTINYDPDDVSAFTTLSGIKYIPKHGAFGVKASVLAGLQDRHTLDADGGITMEFNHATGGVNSVFFNMNGRFINDYTQPIAKKNDECMGLLTIGMKMNFVEESFMFGAKLNFGVPSHNTKTILYASANLDFFAGSTGWFIHVGRPWTDGELRGGNPIEIEVLSIAKFKGYLQCGSGSGSILRNESEVKGIAAVDPMPPIPNFIMNIIHGNHSGEEGSYANSENVSDYRSEAISGGIAFGANFDYNVDVSVLIFYLKARLMVGYDVSFIKLDQNAALCRDEDGNTVSKGVNGFYAEGQAYIGAAIDLGVNIDLFFFSGKFSIVEAGAAAYIQMGIPNPTFFKGAIGGRFSVLGGLISGNFSVPFYIGEKCTSIVGEEIPLIASVSPETEFDLKNLNSIYQAKELQEVYAQPIITFNYKVNHTFPIKIPVPDPEEEGGTYIEYRYYHILPSDVNLSLGATDGGIIWQDAVIATKPLHIEDFTVSNDEYSFVPQVPLLFEKEKNFKIEVSTGVRIFNLGLASKGANKNYTNSDRNQWKLAVDANDIVYIDKRKFTFKTNCGIKEIKDEWISDMRPFHRTQNNPYGVSEGIRANELREASKPFNSWSFKTTNHSQRQLSILNRSIGVKKSNYANDFPTIFLEAAGTGQGSSSFMFDERVLCIPDDFKNNFDFSFRFLSYDKTGDYNTYQKRIVNAEIENGKTIKSSLDRNYPINSNVIVQAILKKKVQSNNMMATNFNSELKTLKTVTMNNSNYNVKKRIIPLSTKLANTSSENVLYTWYMNTGKFETYKDKMKGIQIKTEERKNEHFKKINGGNHSGFSYFNFDINIKTYKFFGNEQFDHHDVNNFSLTDLIPNTNSSTDYDKMLEAEYLAYAFENSSQEIVDSFLRTYINEDDKALKNYFFGSESDYQYKRLIDNYITEKMLDAQKWNSVENYNVLPIMQSMPPDLVINGKAKFSIFSKEPKHLFSIERISKYNQYLGKTTKVFPAHIITMKDIKDYEPGDKFPVLQSLLSDIMTDFDRNIEGQVVNGFKPQVLLGL